MGIIHSRQRRPGIVIIALSLGLMLVTPGYAPPVNAQSCGSFVGQTVSPFSIDDALAPYKGITPKDEFETTAAYNKRIAVIAERAPSILILGKVPESRDYFEYEADRQMLRIKKYAFDNTNFSEWDALYHTDLQEQIPVDITDNISVVISATEKPTGTYEASNAYGKSVTVTKTIRTVKAIFDRKYPGYRSGPSIFQSTTDDIVGELSLPSEEARRLKPLLGIAFVVKPFAPYIVEGEYPGKPTINYPFDVTTRFTILFADLRCALLLDDRNTVLASYRTY